MQAKSHPKQLEIQKSAARHSNRIQFARSKLLASLDYIFGRRASAPIAKSEIDFEFSRKTGRLRYIVSKESREILFTFRPNGSIAPTIAGASILLPERKRKLPVIARPPWTVTVINGVSEIVSQGKTVFSKHVVSASDSIRAGDDVAILNEDGELLAVGRAIIAGYFMKQFKRGAAVKVREGSGKRVIDARNEL